MEPPKDCKQCPLGESVWEHCELSTPDKNREWHPARDCPFVMYEIKCEQLANTDRLYRNEESKIRTIARLLRESEEKNKNLRALLEQVPDLLGSLVPWINDPELCDAILQKAHEMRQAVQSC